MKIMTLTWKEFSVDLEKVDAKLKADYPNNFAGNQAHRHLELVFTESLTDEMMEDIQEYWDGITEASVEATSYRSATQISDALSNLKTGLLAKSWDQMSVVERKMVTNQSVTKAELVSASLL